MIKQLMLLVYVFIVLSTQISFADGVGGYGGGSKYYKDHFSKIIDIDELVRLRAQIHNFVLIPTVQIQGQEHLAINTCMFKNEIFVDFNFDAMKKIYPEFDENNYTPRVSSSWPLRSEEIGYGFMASNTKRSICLDLRCQLDLLSSKWEVDIPIQIVPINDWFDGRKNKTYYLPVRKCW